MNQSVLTWMSVGDSFESNNGTLYFVNVKLEDGTEGAAFSKSERPPYAVGQLVEYNITGQFKNGSNKLQVKVPKDNPGAPYKPSLPRGGSGSGSASGGKSSYNSDGARIGMAINNAVQLACHGKIDKGSISKWAKGLVKLANELEADQGTSGTGQEAPVASQQSLPANMTPVEPATPPPPPQLSASAQNAVDEGEVADDDIPF